MRLTNAMLDATMPVVQRQRFGVADVRDVADLHIRAMATPEAAAKRFLALGRRADDAGAPRPAQTTIVETAESLRDLGLLEKTSRRGAHPGH